MAEAPDTTGKSGLEELEGEITCPVCHEYFCDPKILPTCLHYYCKECVGQLARRAGLNNPFACPECRKETVLPQNDPDQLPTAFMVNRMKELHAKMEKAHGKVEAICEMCSRAKAEAFCRQCTDFICKECVRSHSELKVFAGHKVVTLQELKKGGAKTIPLKEAPPSMCKDHDEQLKIFCFDCNRLICQDCTILDHADHKFELVRKKTLKESLVPLAEIQTNSSAATKQMQLIEAPPSMCKHHDEPLKMFCFQCECLICRDCIISDHAGHKFDFVKKSAPQKTLKESVSLDEIQTNTSAATQGTEKVEGGAVTLKVGRAEKVPLKESPSCKDYEKQLRFFCFDCNHFICEDCEHVKFEFVTKLTVPLYRKPLKESLAPLAKIQTNISAATSEVEVVEREVSEQHKAVTGTIQQLFAQVHEIIHKRENQLMDKASELKQQKLHKLEVQKRGFALATSEIQNFMEFVEYSVENATGKEFVSLRLHAEEQIEKLCEKHECMNLIPVEVANTGVRVACAEGISDLCQRNAELIVLPADPTKCRVEDPGAKEQSLSVPTISSLLRHLRGAEVVAETTFMLTPEAQSFEFTGYGFKLHVPEGSLPVKVSETQLNVQVSLSGQFQLPIDCELVSAVYWVSCPHKFTKPLVVEIQHCAALSSDEQCEQLTFVRTMCTQKELPYTFTEEGGVFSHHSSYGSFSLSHFSGVGVGRRRGRKVHRPRRARAAPYQAPSISMQASEQTTNVMPSELSPHSDIAVEVEEDTEDKEIIDQYCGQVYTRKGMNDCRVYFVITRNLDADRTVVKKYYSTELHAREHLDMILRFDEDKISLAIPRGGTMLPSGWRIIPLHNPIIRKASVDHFGCGRTIPKCELLLQWPHRDKPRVCLVHDIDLTGAKDCSYFTLYIPDEDNDSSSGIAAHPSVVEEAKTLDIETLAEITSYLHLLDRTSVFNLGLVLGLDYNRLKTMTDSSSFLEDMLAGWLQQVDRVLSTGVPTWKRLVEALKDPRVGQNGLASKIEQDKQWTRTCQLQH